jgi:hypothetical protein
MISMYSKERAAKTPHPIGWSQKQIARGRPRMLIFFEIGGTGSIQKHNKNTTIHHEDKYFVKHTATRVTA